MKLVLTVHHILLNVSTTSMVIRRERLANKMKSNMKLR